MIEACGPVQMKKEEVFYIGDMGATSNTAEMQGVIEVLFWMNSCVERCTLELDADVLFTTNSNYVKGLIEEKFTSRENRVLATLLGRVWKDKKKATSPHSMDTWPLGRCGTRRELQHRWWRRCPLRERETAVCKDAMKTRWNGPTFFTRTDAVSAIAWRTAKRGKASPKQQDPMWLEV